MFSNTDMIIVPIAKTTCMKLEYAEENLDSSPKVWIKGMNISPIEKKVIAHNDAL